MTVTRISSRTAALRDAAVTLRRETDRCTAELRAIEAELGDLDLQVDVEGPCIASRPLPTCHEHEDAPPRARWSFLCYGELDGVGQLLVREFIAIHPGDVREHLRLDHEFSLLGASPNLRAAAVAHMDQFLGQVHAQVRAQLEGLRTAKLPGGKKHRKN